jgi:cytidylate kinase
MEEMPKTAIAISRQMGSGGTYIGYLAARRLGFQYVDREILREAARQLEIDVGVLESLDQRSSGLVENLIRAFTFGAPESPGTPVRKPIYEKDLFAVECRIMNKIAERYNAVIVGRAGFYALRDRPRVIRVFVHAPLEFRVRRIMKVHGLTDEREAERLVEEADRRRARFIKDVTGADWYDARNYHLSIDASGIDFDTGVGMIAGLVSRAGQADMPGQRTNPPSSCPG